MSSDPTLIFYMEKNDCSLRAAQIARQKNSTKWQDAMGEYHNKILDVSSKEEKFEEVDSVNDDVNKARYIRDTLWRQYTQATTNMDSALRPNSPWASYASAYQKAAAGLQKDWQLASERVRKLERQAGSLVPTENFTKFRRGGLASLSKIVKGLPDYLAIRVNSFDRDNVEKAAEDWLSVEWNKGVEIVIGEFEGCFRT